MAKLVFSYSHIDEELRNKLETHLSPLKRMGQIATWHDRRINPGEEFEGQIDANFSEADIILLLVSPDFIASDYCYNVEMTNALERHDKGDAIVIPVILRTCDWHALPFGRLLAATPDGKPIIKYPHLDDGFFDVVSAVKKALEQVNSLSNSNTSAPITKATTTFSDATETNVMLAPRSSNLAIKKDFTDRDLDLARKRGFEFLASFFENSLLELKNRNHDIETDFNRVDSNGFECAVYRNGSRQVYCGIWRNSGQSGLGDILYSTGGISQNSCNDSVTVASDKNTLGYRALMQTSFHGNHDTLLTEEGLAEYFWEQFISPLKH